MFFGIRGTRERSRLLPVFTNRRHCEFQVIEINYWKKITINRILSEIFIFATNLQNIFKWDNWVHHHINMFQLQNDRSVGRKLPVMVLCNHSSQCREVMKSSKLQQPIAVGWLYLFRTGSEERNRLWHCSLPTLGFFKICRFWYSALTPSNYYYYHQKRLATQGRERETDTPSVRRPQPRTTNL